MNLKSPKTLRGKFFDIHLYIESGKASNTIGIKRSELIRHQARLDDKSEYLNPSQIKNRQQTISNILSAKLEFLIFNFSEIVYITESGEQHILELNPTKIAGYINIIFQKSKLKDKTIERFEYAIQHFPYINHPLAKDTMNYEFIVRILDDLGFKYDPDAILILSGEMIWSRYLNTFVIVNILRGFHCMKYIYLDGNGVWDYLLRNEKIGDFSNLDKKELLPQILYLELPGGKNKITIQANSDIRNVYLINSVNIFNFTAGEYEYEGNMIPEFFIINEDLKSNRNNKFTQIKVDIYQNHKQSIIVIPQLLQKNVSKRINLLMGDSQECIKKVGDWVDENEMIGAYKIFQNEYYFIPKGYTLKVFHGQLVKKGELIAEQRFKAKINAKNAGKVDLHSYGKSLVKLLLNEEQKDLISPFSGEVIAKGGKGEITLSKVDMKVFKVDAYIGKGISAKLSKEVIKDHVVYCQDYSELSQLLDEHGTTRTDLELRGVIVDYLAWSEYKKLLTMDNKDLNLAVISFESPNLFSNKLISENINSIIYMDKEGIYFKANDQDSKVDLSNMLLKNEIVRFIDFEAQNLYGKIIKSINEKNQNYLVDNHDKIIECNLINLIEIANGK